MRVGSVEVTRLRSGALQFHCEAHGALVTATLKPTGWTKPYRTCSCDLEALQPILDAIQAAQSKAHATGTESLNGSTLRYAIAYARRGIGVFPVHDIKADRQCSCGKLDCPSGGKHPRLKDWQALATTDEAQIGLWWRDWPHANIGVKCGAGSGLTVLDVDGDEGRETLRSLELERGELPETPIAITGSGGAHYYFAFEEGLQNAVRFAPGLDIRTEGGLVVGVGSRTKRTYEWEAAFPLGDELSPARMPKWLSDLIRAATAPAANGARLTLPAQIPAGERNNWLYKLARSLKARGMSAAAIRLAVESENSSRCSPPMEADEVRQLIDHATTEPDQKGFAPAVQNSNGVLAGRPAREIIVSEDYDTAVAANAEYLKRQAIIERLFYTQTISLFVGGKHHGKSTAARTSGMSVMRGVPFLGREVKQGPVIYAASGGSPGRAHGIATHGLG